MNPESIALALTPHGHLLLAREEETADALAPEIVQRLETAFSRGSGHGLLQLGAGEIASALPAGFAFWREFASCYVTALCTLPDNSDPPSDEQGPRRAAKTVPPIAPPPAAELEWRALSAPLMTGAEYLTGATLAALWREIDAAFRRELAEAGCGVQEFLKRRNPAWNLVGRVCFNLAENRGDDEHPFAFLATYTVRLSAHSRAQHLPLGQALDEYKGPAHRDRLLALLLPVQRASERCAWLKTMVDAGEIYYPLRWTAAEAARFLRDAEPLEQAGVVLRMPANWSLKRPPRPRVTGRVGNTAPSRLGQDALLDFRMSVTLEGEPLSEAEIRRLLSSTEGLALVRGRWVEVDSERLRRMMDRFGEVERAAAADGLSFGEAMRLLSGVDSSVTDEVTEEDADWARITAGPWFADTLKALRREDGLERVDPGAALKTTLRPYQQIGLRWLYMLTKLGLGACLADDMGLGKTIQVIALLLVLKHEKNTGDTPGEGSGVDTGVGSEVSTPHILGAPLMPQPYRGMGGVDGRSGVDAEVDSEASTPPMRDEAAHEWGTQINHEWGTQIRGWDTQTHERDTQINSAQMPSILVAPASLLANWAAEIERFAPELKVLIAHPSALSAEELKGPSGDRLAKTDLVITSYGSLLRLPWLTETAWRLAVLDEAQAIKNSAAKQTRNAKKLKARSRFALTGTPVENRLGDLWSIFDFINPGLLGSAKEFTRYARQLAERQHNPYGPLRELVRPYILRRLKTDKSVIADLPEKTEMKAFCSLSRRQAALYQQAVDEFAERLDGFDGPRDIHRRGLVLKYLMRFKQICNHPSQWLGDNAWSEGDSGKWARLREIAEVIAARQEKALVFTQFREITAPLAAYLASIFGRPGLVLHGETAVKGRKALVERFQDDESAGFFVLSLKAGGTGLNLTAASHVIHFDRWWNPAVENQATDRAFRIGQRKNVMVHTFVCRGTVEEKIDQMIESKRRLAQDMLDIQDRGAETLLTEMKDDELLRLVALDLNSAVGEG